MENLGERLARGEQAAFAELYDTCADRLHHYLTARLGSGEDADDVLQNTFVRLAQARRRLGGIENLMAYVFKIARNELADFRGRKVRESEVLSERHRELLCCRNAGDIASTLDDAELVAAALTRLTLDEREIVELKIYGRLAVREIAEIVGVPQGTAATRYRTALERMKRWYREGPQ